MSSTGGGPHLVVSSGDHEAFVVLTTVSCLTWTLLVLVVRLYIRFRLNGPFGHDDTAASIATVIAVIQTSVTLAGVRYGIGEKADLLTPGEVDKALKCLYAGSILYILSICATKCSMFQLIARLTRTKSHTFASHLLTGFTFLWGVAAVFAVAFQCEQPTPWNTITPGKCPHLFLDWATIEAFSLLIEGLICALSLWLVWSLQMSMKLKAAVVAAFLLRVLIIIPTAFKLVLLRRDLPSSDATFMSTNVVIATQVTMHYSVMAATFPCMRAFLQTFNSGLGATTGLSTAAIYASNAYTNGSKAETNQSSTSYALESVDRDVENKRATLSTSFRPDDGHTTTTTITSGGDQQQAERGRQHRAASKGSLDSDESKQPIIKKTLEWEVRHESRDLE